MILSPGSKVEVGLTGSFLSFTSFESVASETLAVETLKLQARPERARRVSSDNTIRLFIKDPPKRINIENDNHEGHEEHEEFLINLCVLRSLIILFPLNCAFHRFGT